MAKKGRSTGWDGAVMCSGWLHELCSGVHLSYRLDRPLKCCSNLSECCVCSCWNKKCLVGLSAMYFPLCEIRHAIMATWQEGQTLSVIAVTCAWRRPLSFWLSFHRYFLSHKTGLLRSHCSFFRDLFASSGKHCKDHCSLLLQNCQLQAKFPVLCH